MLYALSASPAIVWHAAEESGSQGDDMGSARQRAKVIDGERTLARAARARDDVARLAGLGWQPTSTTATCCAPRHCQRWFPKNTWRQLDEQLTAIKKGAYPWAGIHQYRDAL